MIDKNEEIKDLLLSAQEGNQAAFGRLYRMHADAVYRFVYFRVSDEQIAHDLVSEIFIKIWKTIPHYVADPKVKFSTWVFTIAKNRVIDYYRIKKHTVDLEGVEQTYRSGKDLQGEVAASMELEQVREAMKKIKPEYALIIELKHFQEMDYKEIAKIMKKTEVGVRVLLHRATLSLKKKLK